MDKLRALQYFVATAHAGSFSRAARDLGVSVQAVAKLVSALETELEVRLLERTARGVTLTATGAAYLGNCAPALEQLIEADELTKAATMRSRGTIVVGIQHAIASGCVTAALPRFHALFPDIELDLRYLSGFGDEQLRGVDVMLVLGWPKAGDLVHRRIHAGRFLVVASPAYWSAHGMPQRPKDLEHHPCLNIRGLDGTVMDLWTFVRGDEQESALARGWLTCSNAHRDIAFDLALAGAGVVRIIEWMNLPEQRSGQVVRALPDWESLEAPPVNLLYRPSVRRIPRVRAFIDFVIALFRDLDTGRTVPVSASEKPRWLRRHYARSSAVR